MFKPENIKKIRLSLLLTQQEFAELLGVTYESVNRYENGKSNPTLKVQRKLLDIVKKNNLNIE